MIKIYVSNNYFFIELPDNSIPLSDNNADVRIFLIDSEASKYRIISPLIGEYDVLLSDASDENGTAYTVTTWNSFFELNSGASSNAYDPILLLSKGSSTQSHINKFGKNYDVDSGSLPETIFSGGGLYVPPTAARTHQIASTLGSDSGSLVTSETVTSVNILLSGNIEITSSDATFQTDSVSVGDTFIDNTTIDHSVVVSIDSETKITVQPLHDGGGVVPGDSFSLVTADSTGAGVMHIFGLDSDCNEIKEFIILDGTTNVATAHEYLRINRCHSDLTGAAKHNDGDITLTADVDGTVTGFVRAGDGQTLQAFFTVPNGKTGYVTMVNLSSHRIGSTSNAMVSAELRATKFIPQGNISIIEDTISVSLVGTSYNEKNYKPYKVFKQRTDIWLEIDYSTDNNMIVSGGFDVILEDN